MEQPNYPKLGEDFLYSSPITLTLFFILCAFWQLGQDRNVLRTSEKKVKRRNLIIWSIIGFVACSALFLHVCKSTFRERKVDSDGSVKYVNDLTKLLEHMKYRARRANTADLDLQSLIENQMKTFFEEVDETFSGYEPGQPHIPKILAVLTNESHIENFTNIVRDKCLTHNRVADLTAYGAQIKKTVDMITETYNSLKEPIEKARTTWRNLTNPVYSGIGYSVNDVDIYLTTIPPLLDKIQEGLRKSVELVKADKEIQFNKRRIISFIPFFLSGALVFCSFVIMICTIIYNSLPKLKSPFPLILSIIYGIVYFIIVAISLFVFVNITLLISNRLIYTFPCSNISLPLDDFVHTHQPIASGRYDTNISFVLSKCNHSRRVYTLLDVYISPEDGVEKLEIYEDRVISDVFPVLDLHVQMTLKNDGVIKIGLWNTYEAMVYVSLIDPNITQEIDKSNQAIIDLKATMKPECHEEMSQILPDFVPFVLNATKMDDYLENYRKAEKYVVELDWEQSFAELMSFYRTAVRKLNEDIDPSHLQCGQILGVFNVGGCQDSDDDLRKDLELNASYIIAQCIVLLMCWFISSNLVHFSEKSRPPPPEPSPIFPVVPGITTLAFGLAPKENKSKTPKVKKETSESKPRTPESKPKAPESKPKTPESKPKTPESKPKTPESKPKTPESKPKTPGSKPKTPESKPKASQSKTPESKPKTPESKPKGSRASEAKTMASRTQESRMTASRTQNSVSRSQKSKYTVTKTQESQSTDAPQ